MAGEEKPVERILPIRLARFFALSFVLGVEVTTESFCNVWSRGSDGSEGMVGIVGRDGFGGRGAAHGITKSAEAIVIVSPTVWR